MVFVVNLHILIFPHLHINCITLLSDFGTRDASLSVAKATLMRYSPASPIVDISHNVIQYDLQQAAYLLASAYTHFPQGTVNIVMMDVFAGNNPRMLLNGILSLTFGTEFGSPLLCFEFSKPYNFSEWINSAGKVIGTIPQKGHTKYSGCEAKSARRLMQPQLTLHGIDCNILYVDRYENVVLDITRKQFDELAQGRPFKIKIMRMDDITTISRNYNDVPEGEALCRFNNAGFLELALNHAPAATLLGLGSYNSGSIRYQTIRIFF